MTFKATSRKSLPGRCEVRKQEAQLLQLRAAVMRKASELEKGSQSTEMALGQSCSDIGGARVMGSRFW